MHIKMRKPVSALLLHHPDQPNALNLSQVLAERMTVVTSKMLAQHSSDQSKCTVL